MKSPPSPKQIIFRDRLKAYIGSDSVGAVARRLGIEYKRFQRRSTDGIERPTHRSLADVKRLASAMGLTDWRLLWEPDSATVKAEYRAIQEKVKLLYADAQTYRGRLVKGIDMLWGQW